jgi:hypothetical protein
MLALCALAQLAAQIESHALALARAERTQFACQRLRCRWQLRSREAAATTGSPLLYASIIRIYGACQEQILERHF